MKDCDQFEPFPSKPVRNDVRGVGNNQLARATDPTRPADFRMSLKEVYRFEDAAGDECCIFFGVFFDVLAQANQMPNCAPGPDDVHRGGLDSPGFPQDLSHFETFSWLTPCPESSSAIPA